MSFENQFEFLGNYLLSTMKNHPDLELIAVVVVIPSILNSICFWVTDNFLRGDSTSENMSQA